MDDVNNKVDSVDNPESVDYRALYEHAMSDLHELTAERNSLRSENDSLRNAETSARDELSKTKEINYTLSRQLNIEKDTLKQPEEYLADMFLKTGGKNHDH